MKCRNRLHYQFNRNRRLLSRLNWRSSPYIILRWTAIVVAGFSPSSSFVMVMFRGRPFPCLCALNPDSSAASTVFVANFRFVQLHSRRIIYFNPSRKYFSTTLITSTSCVIHQILLKNSTKLVRFCWPLTFGPIDRCAAISASLLIHFKLKVAQRYAGLQTIATRS